MPTGQIVEWNRDRGFGYVKSADRRLLLNIHDITGRNRSPNVGDQVQFVAGADQEGRPCALHAVLPSGGIKAVHFLILLVLLVAPALAFQRLAGIHPVSWLAGYAAGIWLVTFLVFAWDKRKAATGGWREPEGLLHLLELAGGWPAAFVAQRVLRHKTAKRGYQAFFWMIVFLHQFIAVDYLRGWPLTQQVAHQWAQWAGGR